MSPLALQSIGLLDEAILAVNHDVIVKAGPKLWAELKRTGRAFPCPDRTAVFSLDQRINVFLDGLQKDWEFMLLRVGTRLV